MATSGFPKKKWLQWFVFFPPQHSIRETKRNDEVQEVQEEKLLQHGNFSQISTSHLFRNDGVLEEKL
jgi:hypothetical protein